MTPVKNGNWKTAVTIVIGVLVAIIGWLAQEGYSSIKESQTKMNNKLDAIQVQTGVIPAMQTDIAWLRTQAASNTADIKRLEQEKLDKHEAKP